MANSNKGFSLIELMIVVAIIGILSAIAIPNFQKFQAKSRQSEAKANLAALYTAQKAFSAEWNMYFGDFRDLGFAPEGTLRYNISNGGGGPALPSDYTHVGAACTATPCDAFTASTEWNTIAYCAGGGAGACTPSAQFAENATVIPGSVAPTATAFVAAAGGNIDNDATFDRWTMNQNKVLTNTQDDVMTP